MCLHSLKKKSVCLESALECIARTRLTAAINRGRHGRFEERHEDGARIQARPYPPATMLPEQADNNSIPQEGSTEYGLEYLGFDWSGRELVPCEEPSSRRQIMIGDGGRMVCVGEPSLFFWLDSDQTDSKRVHRTIDEAPLRHCDPTQLPFSGGEVLVFTEPEQDLLDSFCQNFLPIYPIVNKNDLLESWKSGTISPLLKQSVLFIGALHCKARVLTNAGFSCKQDAMELYHRKARQHYDNDSDLDRVRIIQSMFMLQFRFGTAAGHKDCFWWASAAVNLAQMVGMHRCTKNTTMKPEDQRLWKKIWWLLYVTLSPLSLEVFAANFQQIRDRQLASGMGKPMMIDDRDCDVEELTVDDFVDGEPSETSNFIVSMARLAKISMQEPQAPSPS